MQDTSQVTESQEETKMKNPYPGLRPFLQEESHLFFGRENQVSDVLEKLINNNFIAIIGNSGIGKSSFINCGILPKLYADHPGAISSEWDVISFRPANDPLLQLAKAFTEEVNNRKLYSSDNAPVSSDVRNILSSNGFQGFSELVKNFIKSSGKNLLLFIDQFEEVFRFRPENQDVTDEISLFIDILIKTAKSKEIPVFVVITMRSDYIGECSRYPILTSAINESQFLIPQMTREEKKAAIIGPCKVMGAKISDSLINEVLNKVGDDADQLPVMQHSLMRTWNYWEENKIGKEEIGISHYNAIGGMEKALSVHANEVFNNLPSHLKVACEKCFKSLTEKGEEGRSFRRPATLKELSDIAQTSTNDIKEIVNNFRQPGVTILTPPHNVELIDETIIDISHESLMRIWSTLTNWMEEESESTKQYLKIAEAAELHQSGKGAVLKSPELQMGTNWYHSEKPTKAWGIRHHVAYDRTIEYLLFSEKYFLRKQRLKTRQQKRRLFIARLIAMVFGTGAIIAAVLVVFALKKRDEANISKQEADKQAVIAKEKSVEALKSAEEAQLQKSKAEMEALRALRNEKAANESRKKAEEERQFALAQKEIANDARQKAVIEEQKALKLRMFSIARSMAVKSLQEPDLVTKSLVSRQAYNFYFDNGGTGTDPDIYNALYYSVKALKGNNFNTLSGHTDNVRAIVTNANDKRFYSTSSDGRIFRWTETSPLNFEKTVIDEFEDNVNKSMAISSNGKWLVVGGDYPYLRLFNLTNDKMRSEKIQTGSQQISFLGFTPDNKNIIYAGSNRKIKIWDFDESKEIDQPATKINALDIDPNGRYLAVALEDGTILTYDIQNNFSKKVLFTERANMAITSMKFSENGMMLAIGNIKGAVRILNFESAAIVASLTGHTARINQIRFNHADDKLATASYDHTVRIWDLENLYNKPVVLDDHKNWVWSIGFSHDDGYLFAGCVDNLVRAWIMDIHNLSQTICRADTINRNLNAKEWESYVADDIELECSCKKNCSE